MRKAKRGRATSPVNPRQGGALPREVNPNELRDWLADSPL